MQQLWKPCKMAKLSVSVAFTVSARLCTNVTTMLLTTIEFYKAAYIINPVNSFLLTSVGVGDTENFWFDAIPSTYFCHSIDECSDTNTEYFAW